MYSSEAGKIDKIWGTTLDDGDGGWRLLFVLVLPLHIAAHVYTCWYMCSRYPSRMCVCGSLWKRTALYVLLHISMYIVSMMFAVELVGRFRRIRVDSVGFRVVGWSTPNSVSCVGCVFLSCRSLCTLNGLCAIKFPAIRMRVCVICLLYHTQYTMLGRFMVVHIYCCYPECVYLCVLTIS